MTSIEYYNVVLLKELKLLSASLFTYQRLDTSVSGNPHWLLSHNQYLDSCSLLYPLERKITNISVNGRKWVLLSLQMCWYGHLLLHSLRNICLILQCECVSPVWTALTNFPWGTQPMDISDAKLPISASTVRIKGHFSADSIINQAVCCRNFKEYKVQLILI